MSFDVAQHLEDLHDQLLKWGWPDPYLIEHGVDHQLAHALDKRDRHSAWVTTPPTYLFRLVILHAPACGCNTIPDEVVLHG